MSHEILSSFYDNIDYLKQISEFLKKKCNKNGLIDAIIECININANINLK